MKPADVKYRLAAVRPNGTLVFLENFVTDLTVEERDGELAQRVTARARNHRLAKRRIAQLLPNGAEVRVFAGVKRPPPLIFRGRVFSNTTDWTDGPMHDIVAYDSLFFLTQSDDDAFYPAGKTGQAILVDTFKRWGVPRGNIRGPDTRLSRKMLRGQRVSTLVDRVLNETRRKGGGRWIVRMNGMKVDVVRRGRNPHLLRFTSDEVSGLTVHRSIEALVTEVKITGRNKQGSRILATAHTPLRGRFGRLRRIVARNDFDSPAKAKRAAMQLLREEGQQERRRSFVAPDVPALRRGMRVIVRARTLQGQFIVIGVVHDADSRTMVVDVERPQEPRPNIDFRAQGLWTWKPPEDRQPDPPKTGGGISGDGFMWPAQGPISSGGRFGAPRGGRKHLGLDIAIPTGTPLRASKAGRVSVASNLSGYGLVIYIDHGGGWQTRYAHMSSFAVGVGAQVSRGQVIGRSGATGNASGPHLHFEVRQAGTPIDPERVLP